MASQFLDIYGLESVLGLLKGKFDSIASQITVIGEDIATLRNHTHPTATQQADGFMSKEDKLKLDSMAQLSTDEVSADSLGEAALLVYPEDTFITKTE